MTTGPRCGRRWKNEAPHFAQIGEAPVHGDTAAATWSGVGRERTLWTNRGRSRAAIADYYLTNPIARASETMAQCSRELVHGAAKMAAE